MNEVIDQSVIGEYRLIHQLGEGGMGSVWLAEHVVLGKRFAIKFLLAENADNPDLRARFEQEARTIGRLDHPNVVSATNFGFTPDGQPYLVMEALRGHSLRGLLDQALGATGRPLDPARAIALIRDAGAGIAHAHEHGVIHRDLKPENLFAVRTVTGAEQVKVLDFGIAKIRSAAGLATHKTQTGMILGTPYYMSYEQARGESDIDFRTDIYSLAAILYELVSGTRPREGEHYNAIIADIITRDPTPLDEASLGLPPGLSAVLLRGMSRVRDHRFQTIADFDAALGALAPGAMAITTPPANLLVTPVQPTDTVLVPRSVESRPNTAPTAPATNLDLDRLATSARTTHARTVWAALLATIAIFALTGSILTLWRTPRGAKAAAKLEQLSTAATRSPEVLVTPLTGSSTTAQIVDVKPVPIPATPPQEAHASAATSQAPAADARPIETSKRIAVGSNSAKPVTQANRAALPAGGTSARAQTAVPIRIPKNPY
jgi:serine/threonine-protein kinase